MVVLGVPATVLGSVLRSVIVVDCSCVKFDLPTEIVPVMESGVDLAVVFINAADIGRADIGLLNLLAGLGSLGFSLPNPKSLLKNPCFSTSFSANNGLGITATARDILTKVGWVGLLFNNDEGSGVCSDRKQGTFVLDVDTNATEVGSSLGCEDSKFCSLRAGLLFEAARELSGPPSGCLSTSVR